MSKTFVLALLCCLSLITPGFSQADFKIVADSLKQQVRIADNDSLKAEIFHVLGNYYRRNDFDSSRYFFQKGIESAEKADILRLKSRELTGIAITFGMQSNYPEALNYFNQAKLLNESIGHVPGIRSSYMNLGIVYKRIGEYETSFEYYNSALEIAISEKDSAAIATLYQSIGVLQDIMGQQDAALDLFRKSAAINSSISKTEGIDGVYNSIAIIHLKQKNYDSAEWYLNRYIDGNQLAGNTTEYVNGLSNIGNLYVKTGDYELALLKLKEAEKKAIEINLPHELSNIWFNMSEAYIHLNNLSQALEIARKNETLNNDYMNLGDQSELMEQLSKILEAQGNIGEALHYFKRHKMLSDSLLNQENSLKFDNQNTKLAIIQRDTKLREQSLQVDILESRVQYDQRLRLVYSIGGVMLLIIVFLLYRQNRHKQRLNKVLSSKNQLISSQKQEIESINNELETRMLRAQMNPHFIFNSLSSIQHFILKNDAEAAHRYLSKFSKLLRSVLESSTGNKVTLSAELELLSNYIELESLRFNQNFEFQLDLNPSIDAESTEIPLLLLQPFLENAIIHGLMPSEKSKKILSVAFDRKEDLMICTITDNGIGREKSAALKGVEHKKHRSRGLEVTLKRLKKVNEHIEEPIVFEDVLDENNEISGTKVIITIEIE